MHDGWYLRKIEEELDTSSSSILYNSFDLEKLFLNNCFKQLLVGTNRVGRDTKLLLYFVSNILKI